MTLLLNAMERTQSAKKVRRLGYVPGSIYGPGIDSNLNIQLDKKELNKFLRAHSTGAKARIKIKENEFPCVIKNIQYELLSNVPSHIEFYASSEDKLVKVKVPLRFKGKELLSKNNLVVNILQDEVEIQGVLKDLPEFIELDVANMKDGSIITMNDITLPEGVRLLSKKEEPIARAERASVLVS